MPEFTPGVQMANSQPAMCLQGDTGSAATTPLRNLGVGEVVPRATEDLASSEDCLFLKYAYFMNIALVLNLMFSPSVFVPGSDLARKKLLPVVFWIHGYVRRSKTLI